MQKIRDLSYIRAKLSNTASPRLSDTRESIGFEVLTKLFGSNSNCVLHLIGVGNPLRKDDGVGIQVIRKLMKKRRRAGHHFIIHPPTRTAESIMSMLNYEKDQALVFDAVQCNSAPGSIIFTTLSDSRYGFFTTHNIPLKTIPTVSNHLDSVFVLGIQPSDVEFGEGLSSPVQESMDRVVEQLSKLMMEDI